MKKIFLILLSFSLSFSLVYIPVSGEEEESELIVDRDTSVARKDGLNNTKKSKKKKSQNKITLQPAIKDENGNINDGDNIFLFLDRTQEEDSEEGS